MTRRLQHSIVRLQGIIGRVHERICPLVPQLQVVVVTPVLPKILEQRGESGFDLLAQFDLLRDVLPLGKEEFHYDIPRFFINGEVGDGLDVFNELMIEFLVPV